MSRDEGEQRLASIAEELARKTIAPEHVRGAVRDVLQCYNPTDEMTQRLLPPLLERLATTIDVAQLQALGRVVHELSLHRSAADSLRTELIIAAQLHRIGQFDLALQWLPDGDASAPTLKAIIDALRVTILMSQHRDDEVERLARGLVETADQSASARIRVIARYLVADAALRGSKATEAEALIHAALEMYQAAVNIDEEAEALVLVLPTRVALQLRLVTAYKRQSRHDVAIDYLRSSIADAQAAQESLDEAWLSSELGLLYQAAGEMERGQAYLRHAAELAIGQEHVDLAMRWWPAAVANPPPAWQLTTMGKLAAALVHANRGLQARKEAFELASDVLADHTASSGLKIVARSVIAACFANAGKPYEARARMLAARELADEAGEALLALHLSVNLALILWQAHLFGEARQAAEDAFSRGEALLVAEGGSELRQNVQAALAQVYDCLIWLGIHAEGDRARTAIRWITRARARNLSAWLDAVHSARDGQAVADTISFELANEARLDSPSSPQAALTELEYAARSRPRYASRSEPTLASVQQGLAPGDVVLDLHAADAGVACLWVTHAGADCVWLVSRRSERVAMQARFVRAWENDIQRLSPARAPREWRRDERGRRNRGRAVGSFSMRHAYDEADAALLDAVRGLLPPDTERVLVAHSAELAYLPWWSLLRDHPHASLTRLPGMACLSTLRKARGREQGRRYCVGDASRTLTCVPRELASLPGFETLPPSLSDMSTMADVSAFHFAGHGVFEEAQPYRSGLIVRQSMREEPFVIDESQAALSRLTVPGVVRHLRLAGCELAVLSSCSNGVPRSHLAGEMTGVSTAFLLAGALNVVAASWPVMDAATMLLMRNFYDEWARGSNPATALARARACLAKMSREEACSALDGDELIPSGDMPFDYPLFTDAFHVYGQGWRHEDIHPQQEQIT